MKTPEDKIVYRYFGIEFRIIFYFVGSFFLLLSVITFKSFLFLSLAFFLISLLIIFLTYLDFIYHLLCLDEKGISLKRVLPRDNLKETRIQWSQINHICTQEYGIFRLLKTTQIYSSVKEKIKVFSFMEDYYHFLKDLCERSKNVKIDKFTQNLLSGKADF